MLYIIPVKESNTQKSVGGEFKEPTDVTRYPMNSPKKNVLILDLLFLLINTPSHDTIIRYDTELFTLNTNKCSTLTQA